MIAKKVNILYVNTSQTGHPRWLRETWNKLQKKKVFYYILGNSLINFGGSLGYKYSSLKNEFILFIGILDLCLHCVKLLPIKCWNDNV